MLKHRLGTIRTRVLFGFVLIALLPVLSSAVGAVAIGIYNGRQQARERLQSVAVSKELAVREWLGSLQQQLVIVSSTDCSYERIWVVVDLARDNKYLDFYNRAVRNRLQGFVGQSALLEDLFLIDARGHVALSTDISAEGADVSEETYFRQGLEGPFAALPFDPVDGSLPQESSMVTVAMPIVGSEQHVMGVIAGRAQLTALNALVAERTGLGESGKAYLVNADQNLLSGTLPTTGAKLTGIESFLSQETNGSATYRDYRGQRVIGVFRWLPELHAMLFVEQDLSEALGAILTTLSINLIVALTALVLAIGLSLAIMRSITKPLENLAETATLIAAGDLQRHARVEREDEIGVLARAFNSMTAQLRELITSLERRVAERTSQLQRLALQMETSAKVSREVTSILAIDGLLAKVTELIASAFGYYAVHIYLVDFKANKLIFRASSSPIQPHETILDLESSSLNGEVVRTSRALLVNDVTIDPRYLPDENYPDIHSELVIPLRIGDRTIGTLDLASSELGAFQPEDVVVAQSLGDQIAIAIENARLYGRSQELAVLEERNRLAREFHDAMNQSLYSIVLFAGAAHKESEKIEATAIQRHVTKIENMARQALKEMRLMIYELRPRVLEQKGLVGALQQRLDAVESSVGMNVELRVEGELDLPASTEEAIYHIVQEALNNTLKHATATSVVVSLRRMDHQIEANVVDNGVGFDPGNPMHKTGLGLVSMRERAEELGAVLHIQSAPDNGTSVTLLVRVDGGADDIKPHETAS